MFTASSAHFTHSAKEAQQIHVEHWIIASRGNAKAWGQKEKVRDNWK